MLINLSNHPSSAWPAEQIEAAAMYGEVVDWPFPAVSPADSTESIQRLAQEIVDSLPTDKPFTLHVMGEMTLTYAVVSLCKARGITCIASTTERIAQEDGDGTKVSIFKFVGFREY